MGSNGVGVVECFFLDRVVELLREPLSGPRFKLYRLYSSDDPCDYEEDLLNVMCGEFIIQIQWFEGEVSVVLMENEFYLPENPFIKSSLFYCGDPDLFVKVVDAVNDFIKGL